MSKTPKDDGIVDVPSLITAKLPNIKRLDRRGPFLKKNGLKLLGSGSTRHTFALTDTVAVKVAKNQSGIDQNKLEIKNSKTWEGNHIAKVLDYGDSSKWLIVERALPYDSSSDDNLKKFGKAFNQTFGVTDANYVDYAIQHGLLHVDENGVRNKEHCHCYQKATDLVAKMFAKQDKWFLGLLENLRKIRDNKKNNYITLDLHMNNWGILPGNKRRDRLVIVDYGLVTC